MVFASITEITEIVANELREISYTSKRDPRNTFDLNRPGELQNNDKYPINYVNDVLTNFRQNCDHLSTRCTNIPVITSTT